MGYCNVNIPKKIGEIGMANSRLFYGQKLNECGRKVEAPRFDSDPRLQGLT